MRTGPLIFSTRAKLARVKGERARERRAVKVLSSQLKIREGSVGREDP